MADDAAVTAQIVQLLRHHPPGVWELVEPQGTARAGDIVLCDATGAPVAYARSAARDAPHRYAGGLSDSHVSTISRIVHREAWWPEPASG